MRRRIHDDPDARERALDALALSRREGYSLSRSARMTRTTPRTVLRYSGQGWRREGRRWRPKAFDRIPREMNVLAEDGPVLLVLDSRQATIVADHANAVESYLRFGDESGLRRLRRTRVRVDGVAYELPTDPAALDRLAEGGELHYELYRR
jgi:hypothetical protein